MTDEIHGQHPPHPRYVDDTSDPTALTVKMLQRELDRLQELIYVRLQGMDQATMLLREASERMPSDVDIKVGHLRSIHEEKFRSIEIQFRERDVRTDQTSKDSKVAVDAALQAAKEAVGEQNKSSALAIAKSEASTTKQIDQQGLLIATATAGLNDKIDDLKQRLTQIEGKSTGVAAQQNTQTSLNGFFVGIAGVLVAVGGVILAFVR